MWNPGGVNDKPNEPGIYQYDESQARHNDYGHSLRDIGIRRANLEFILVTNGDNYYSPKFVESMFDAIDAAGLDVALCDMVHSHANPGPHRAPPNFPLHVVPLRQHCDIGACCRSPSPKNGFWDRTYEATQHNPNVP